jgi:hypothetical protein
MRCSPGSWDAKRPCSELEQQHETLLRHVHLFGKRTAAEARANANIQGDGGQFHVHDEHDTRSGSESLCDDVSDQESEPIV